MTWKDNLILPPGLKAVAPAPKAAITIAGASIAPEDCFYLCDAKTGAEYALARSSKTIVLLTKAETGADANITCYHQLHNAAANAAMFKFLNLNTDFQRL